MTDTNGTAPALESATITAIKSSAVERPWNPSVIHFYWVEDGEIAQQLGVDHRMLCGVWAPPPDDPRHALIASDADGRPLLERHDCRRCVRVLSASWREQRER